MFSPTADVAPEGSGGSMKWLLHGLPDGPPGFMDRVPDLSYGAAGAESSNGFEAFWGDVELLDWMDTFN